MELDDIKAIIEMMKANDLSVFEMEREGEKLKLERGSAMAAPVVTYAAQPAPAGQPALPAAPAAAAPAPAGKEILSPMVGTFYMAASPETPTFVSVGQEVSEDTVVCIIEAMKVMNEIKAEVRGVIAEIVAENGKPVQFGQPLFRLK